MFPEALRELVAQFGYRFVFPVRLRAAGVYAPGLGRSRPAAARFAQRRARAHVADYAPMMKLKMALVSLKQSQASAARIRDLLAQPALRGVAVRSNNFGDEENAPMTALEAQHRLSYAAAPVMVACMIKAARADFTVVAPALFLFLLSEDAAMGGFANQVQIAPLDGLPPAESALYVSCCSLFREDHAQLVQLLQLAAKGLLWKWRPHYYPPQIAAYAVRPR